MNIRFDRLRNVVLALEEAPERELPFRMDIFVHPCGTSACVLGEYAARSDLQSDFAIADGGLTYKGSYAPISRGAEHFGFYGDHELRVRPGFHPDYMSELFANDGCGKARTRKEAAEYIRDFIRRNSGLTP